MRNIILRFTIALLAFATGITTAEARVRLTGDLSEKGGGAALVAQTVEELREIKTEQFDNNIPPAAKPLLMRLKHQLRDLIAGTINARRARGKALWHTQSDLLAELGDAGVTVEDQAVVLYRQSYFQEPYAYGDIFGLSLEQPDDHPELLVATTTLSLCCGDDTSLYIFSNTGGRWDLLLAEESNDYDDVSGAQGSFQYAISPADENHEFFVVTTNVNPWCTSNWQSLRYKVLRPGSDAYQPRIILSNKDTIYLGRNPPYSLKLKGDVFSLTFDGDEFMERMNNEEESSPKTHARSHVVKYRISGDLATRISEAKATEKDASDQPR